MQPTDPKEVDMMNNLLGIMEGKAPEKSQTNESSEGQDSWDPNNTPAGVTGQDVDYMKQLMGAFEDKTDNAIRNLNEDRKTDSNLDEAMDTVKTDNGAQIGSWEITTSYVEGYKGKDKKVWNVVNTYTGEPIAKDMFLYEGAYALVKLLNQGYTVTENAVSDVLNLEQEYSHSYMDAAQHKSKAKKHIREGNQNKADLFESRFQASKSSALKAQNQLKNIINRKL